MLISYILFWGIPVKRKERLICTNAIASGYIIRPKYEITVHKITILL